MFAILMLLSVTLASASDTHLNNLDISNSGSVSTVELTVSYWSYQTSGGGTGLLNDGDGDGDGGSGNCTVRAESGKVTILWSAFCWGGGSIEIEVPCESVDPGDLLP